MNLNLEPEFAVAGRRETVSGEVIGVQIFVSEADALGTWLCATVVRDPDGASVRLVGTDIPSLAVGCRVRAEGHWEEHTTHGWQVRVDGISVSMPRVRAGIERYLAATITGCGQATAARLFDALGSKCLDVLMASPAAVQSIIPGAAGVRLTTAVAEWAESARDSRHAWSLTVQLLAQGLSLSDIRLVHRYFREADVAAVAARQRPYRLLQVPGIGWATADRIASALGIAPDAPERITAALVDSLACAQAGGDCGLPSTKLLAHARRRLSRGTRSNVSALTLEQGLVTAEASGELVMHGEIFALPDTALLEHEVASLVAGLARQVELTTSELSLVEPIIASVASASGVHLSDAQQDAARMALREGVAILTGRPGSGKTTTLRVVIECCHALGWPVQVVAPTGKAASRAAEVTGVAACTVHRLLSHLRPMQNAATGGQHVNARLLIVDESSMCDLETARALLMAVVPGSTAVMWVGDADQLPSVGTGALLRDLVASQSLPHSHLVEVRRQQASSPIITNAHRLLDRQPLMHEEREAEEGMMSEWIYSDLALGGRTLDLQEKHGRGAMLEALRRLETDFDVDVRRDAQVLAPTRRGGLGVDALNVVLQDTLNPNGAVGPDVGGDVRVRVGDRVIMTRNLYDLPEGPVFNGEQGVVAGVDIRLRSVSVHFAAPSAALQGELALTKSNGVAAGRVVTLLGAQRKMLRLAWAVTVHRSQGSEYPYALFLFHHESHRRLLDPAVLYTGITRAKRHLHLMSTETALETARTAPWGQRHTTLATRLNALTAAPAL